MILSGDFASYVDYFRQWSDTHPDLKFFLYGGVEKGMDYARSFPDFDYPLAWLEQPIILPGDNFAANHMAVYKTGLSVLVQAPLDDNDAQVAAYGQSFRIMLSLLKKLRLDNRSKTILCDLNSIRLEAVSLLWVDSHYGWRMEMNVEMNLNEFLY